MSACGCVWRQVTVERAQQDPRAATILKANILLHAYLNGLAVAPAHAAEQRALLAKAPALLQLLFELSLYPRLKNKAGSLSLARTVLHFEQFVYQGLWVEDSPLRQLPFLGEAVSPGGGAERRR